ncbi:MAG: hypothetical protein ACK5HY_00055 [Parahaliea sp.]
MRFQRVVGGTAEGGALYEARAGLATCSGLPKRRCLCAVDGQAYRQRRLPSPATQAMGRVKDDRPAPTDTGFRRETGGTSPAVL